MLTNLLPLVQNLLCESFPSPELTEIQTLENKHSLRQAFLFPHQRNLQEKSSVIKIFINQIYYVHSLHRYFKL